MLLKNIHVLILSFGIVKLQKYRKHQNPTNKIKPIDQTSHDLKHKVINIFHNLYEYRFFNIPYHLAMKSIRDL